MSTQETNGGSSSGVLLNTNKEKGKPGRKRGPVWIHFNDISTKKEGHIGCKCMYCGWTQNRGEPAQMQAHLALSCSKVPSTIKIEYLLLIKQNAEERVTNSTSTVSKKRCINLSQTRIDKFYESDQIDSTKQVLCDKAVAKFFVCCGVAFHLISHPFFIDMVKSLCNGYEPPCSTTLSNTLMNNELTKITVDQQLTLDKESDLTLGFDGWTSPRGQSLYVFILITRERKEIIHSLKNLSSESHTAKFLAEKINEVITNIGPEKFSAVVFDHAAACASAKRIIADTHKHIIPIRCIAHHINLITTDICKTSFAKEVIAKCTKLVKFFKTSHQAGEKLKMSIIDDSVKGGNLKTYVKTRWTTAWDCTNSILRLENQLKNLLNECPEILNNEIKSLLRSRSFFNDVDAVNTLLGPVKSAVKALEFKSTTLADCFVELIKLSQRINFLPPISDQNFKSTCIELFNKRWKQFDFDLYILSYMLHPYYRGKGLHPMVFRDVCLNAMKLLKNMGGGENSCSELVAQIRAFTQYEKPYDLEYVLGIDNILSITPHNAGCERVFSIIGWMANKRRTRLNVEKLESMAKLHTYYITNAKSELKFAYNTLSEDQFQNEIQETLSDPSFFDDDDDNSDYDDEDEDYDQNEDEGDDTEAANNNNLEISRWVNIMDKELQELLQTEVKVVIDISPPPPLVDHGSQEFNMEEVLDRILT
ncbi:ribonuclease H-like domain-containing protein [Rhizophagus irregularis DAOM 181602=DAOM 197198]|nr:ribonuclease H-like domain-containing protein [Rhizophagus irregularis DAOM 181602=DAOM 197198]